MEVRSNNKAKHRSQKIAFGLFRLLSLCIVLILFVILGFIIYKGIGAISWEFITSSPTDGMTGGGIWPPFFAVSEQVPKCLLSQFHLNIKTSFSQATILSYTT